MRQLPRPLLEALTQGFRKRVPREISSVMAQTGGSSGSE
jgi:hypothetical protein